MRKTHRLSPWHPFVWNSDSVCLQSPIEKVTHTNLTFQAGHPSRTSLHSIKTVPNPIAKHRKEKIESP